MFSFACLACVDQLVGYLEGDVWQGYALNANVQAAALADGLSALPGFSLLYPTEINMVHIEMPVSVLEALQADGCGVAPRRIRPGDEESGLRYARLVTSWSTTEDDVQNFVDTAASHLAVFADVVESSAGSMAKL
jgi:threonine aldolase